MDLVQVHKVWQSRELTPFEVTRIEFSTDAVPCSKCGCFGNSECRHEPLDTINCCTILDQATFMCQCCKIADQYPTEINPDEDLFMSNGISVEENK